MQGIRDTKENLTPRPDNLHLALKKQRKDSFLTFLFTKYLQKGLVFSPWKSVNITFFVCMCVIEWFPIVIDLSAQHNVEKYLNILDKKNGYLE